MDLLQVDVSRIDNYIEIPFLPISLFKTGKIISEGSFERKFVSSGTTGHNTSKHYIHDLGLYEESIVKGFQYFYGNPDDKVFLLLLPGYLEREDSSLVYMMNYLIERGEQKESGFYLYNHEELLEAIQVLESKERKYVLFGVTYALLDLIETSKGRKISIKNGVIFETGGMKGKRKEIPKSKMHQILRDGFGVSNIYSEYGMTELLSQAYLMGDERFHCPPWMKVLGREINDPLNSVAEGRSLGLNVIDFANLYSCSFIATEDSVNLYKDGSFEVNGRLDNTIARGCNLLL